MSQKIFIPIGLLFLALFLGSVSNAATQQVEISFVNGASPVSNMTFFVMFPPGITPINLKPGMIFDTGVKTLTVAVLKADPYQKISLSLDVEGPAGTYTLSGQLRGQWSQVGQTFQSDQIAINTTISATGQQPVIERIITSPAVIAAAQKVAVPAAVALEVAGGGALASTLVTSNASVAINLVESLRFVQFLSFGFFRLKKQKPWGRVYNQLTNKPIKSATVRVFEATFQKLKDTQFTDADGRFGFLVLPGAYYVTVSKAGFHEYKSQLINVADNAELLDINVPLVSESSALIKAKSVLSALIKILNYLNPYILFLGTVASVGIAFILPTTFNIIVLVTYVLLDAAKFVISHRTLKSFGKVIDKINQQPIALAIVRVFDAERNWLLTSHVTDTQGRFRFLVVPGNYYITCAKESYNPYISQPLTVSKAGAVSWDISLERQITSSGAVSSSPISSAPTFPGVSGVPSSPAQ